MAAARKIRQEPEAPDRFIFNWKVATVTFIAAGFAGVVAYWLRSALQR